MRGHAQTHDGAAFGIPVRMSDNARRPRPDPPTMTTSADWYFDFISPFSYLHWHALRAVGDLELRPIPILFAPLLTHYQHRGPAEIPAKRKFSYRFVHWQAQQAGVQLRFPPAHPFNPLPALRLCVALGSTPAVIDALFTAIWGEGRAVDAALLEPIAARFNDRPLSALLDDPAVKTQLKANGDAALAAGVFGVPTVIVDGELFWGNDSTAFLGAFLNDRQLFAGGDYPRLDHLPAAVSRI
jgi:2-hydroxychromene-2-carboxylate isomerase